MCTAYGRTWQLAASLSNALAAHVPGTRYQPQFMVTPKGTDVPVCLPCADRVSAALDVLLRDTDRSRRSGRNATVAWGRPAPGADEQSKAILELVHYPHGCPLHNPVDTEA